VNSHKVPNSISLMNLTCSSDSKCTLYRDLISCLAKYFGLLMNSVKMPRQIKTINVHCRTYCTSLTYIQLYEQHTHNNYQLNETGKLHISKINCYSQSQNSSIITQLISSYCIIYCSKFKAFSERLYSLLTFDYTE